MNGFIAKKSTGFYLMVAAVLFAIISMISYTVAGRDTFGLQPLVLVFLALAVISGIVFGLKDFFGLGPIVLTVFVCIAFAFLFNARFMYVSHILYGISSEPITAAMVLTLISFAGAIVLSILSAFFKQEK